MLLRPGRPEDADVPAQIRTENPKLPDGWAAFVMFAAAYNIVRL